MTTSSVPVRPPVDALFARWREHGDAGALGRVFDETAAELFRVAVAITPDAATAEDAVQETFLAVIETAHRHDPSRPVTPWLVGILRHKAEGLRRDRARRPDTARVADRGATSPGDAAARAESDARVHAAMERLPEPYRRVALLRWRYGLEPAEIAHVTGVLPGTVRVTLHRALERIRAGLRRGAAFALLPFTGRAPQGLDAVRRNVVRRARSTAAIGGAVMATKTAAGLAAAALLLLAGAWRFGCDEAPAEKAAVSPIASAAPVAKSPRKRDDAPVAAAAVGTPASPSPAPVATVIASRTATTRFVVLTEDGRPIRAATIELIDAVAGRTRGEQRSCGRLVTADDGVAALDEPRGAEWAAYVRAAGHMRAVAGRVFPGETVEVRMRPAATLTLHVVDAAARPVPGPKSVFVYQMTAGHVRLDGDSYDTDGDTLQVPVPVDGPPISVSVGAGGSGHGTWTRAAWGSGPLTDTLELVPPVEIRGIVVDADTGAPVEGAAVRIAGRESVTTADGAFVAAWAASADGLADARLGVYHREYAPARVPVRNADLSAVLCRLDRGRTMSIDVTGPADPRTAHVSYWLFQSVTRTWDAVRADGAFEARHLRSGAMYCGRVDAPGFAPAPFTFVAGPPCADRMRVELRPEVVVRGRCVTRDRRPIAGRRCEVNLVLSSLTDAPGMFGPDGTRFDPEWATLWRGAMHATWFEGSSWITDESGAFELRARPGAVTVRVFDAHAPKAWPETTALHQWDIEVPAGVTEFDLGDVVFDR